MTLRIHTVLYLIPIVKDFLNFSHLQQHQWSYVKAQIIPFFQLVELMSSAVRDLAEGEFVGRRDQQNNPLPSPQGVSDATEDWTLRNVLSAGSLLGKSCQGTLKLAGHGTELQEQGYKFGKHLALAWQVK
jgi:Geranylgeranyl pyrophosphate synthase